MQQWIFWTAFIPQLAKIAVRMNWDMKKDADQDKAVDFLETTAKLN